MPKRLQDEKNADDIYVKCNKHAFLHFAQKYFRAIQHSYKGDNAVKRLQRMQTNKIFVFFQIAKNLSSTYDISSNKS